MDAYNQIDFNEKKGFICDMDGVIYHGNRILPGVAEFIQWLHEENKEYLFLTNNSGYTPRELNQKLTRLGLDVPEEHFYTSALATAAFLKEQAPGCSVFAIGEAGLLNALYDAGITMNDMNPDYVVVGEGRSYSLDTLTKATNLVLGGAKLIGANSDVSGPIENGQAGVFLRQAQSADDAHRAAAAALSFGGGRDGRRPDGHGRNLRNGERYVHGAGAVRRFDPRNAQDLRLPPQHRPRRCRRYPRHGPRGEVIEKNRASMRLIAH